MLRLVLMLPWPCLADCDELAKVIDQREASMPLAETSLGFPFGIRTPIICAGPGGTSRGNGQSRHLSKGTVGRCRMLGADAGFSGCRCSFEGPAFLF